MTAAISIVVRPHWVSGWFLRGLTVPFVLVDGTERPVRWGQPLRLEVHPGDRLVGAGIRYRGGQRLFGYRPIRVDVQPSRELRLVAQNGLLNSDAFRVRVLH